MASTKLKSKSVPKATVERGGPPRPARALASSSVGTWKQPFQASFWAAMLSGLLLWLALPPVGLSPLGWIAPVGWLWLVVRERAPGKAGYWALWIAASLHWLAILEGIRRPYWALHFGWAALSLYLAVYIVLFVASARVLVHRWRFPLWLAAPTCWIGWELARGHVITGFSGAILGHTQVRWTQLIQIADVFGAYGVSFVMMTVAACVTLLMLRRNWKTAAVAISVSIVFVGATLAYGYVRWQAPVNRAKPVRVALLQGTYDTLFEYNPDRTRKMFRQYLQLVERASREHPDLDLIVWPEGTFTEFTPLIIVPEEGLPKDSASPIPPERLPGLIADFATKRRSISGLVNQPEDGELRRNIQQIVGISAIDLTRTPAAHYNSCLLLDARGEIKARYDKNHLVMFGEYIPILHWFPGLYKFTPMSSGTAPGEGAQAFEVAGVRFAPTICFETFVPHLVRRHMRQLNERGTPADVLVNITHDGWFWGSAILDLQQACSIFRAVENRRPLLVAANPGLTTWIDGNGHVVSELRRHDENYLVAEVVPDGRDSLYQVIGDWPAGVCLGLAVVGLLVAWRRRSQPAKETAAG